MLQKCLPVFLGLAFTLYACKKDKNETNGWSKQNILNESFIADISFNNNIGYIAGAFTIYGSVDGGNSWQQCLTDSGGLMSVTSSSEGNFIANSASKYETVFVGNVREKKAEAIAVPSGISGAFFVDAKTAYAGGQYFLKTIDGGNHWDSIFNLASLGETAGYAHFVNENTGWLKGLNALYKTKNSGLSWTKQGLEGFNPHEIFSISFLNEDVAYISDMNHLFKTTNGGDNWQKIYSFADFSGHDLAFLSESEGYSVSKNKIIKTVDGGLTWKVQYTIDPGEDFNTIFFKDEKNGWAGGNKGTLLKFSK